MAVITAVTTIRRPTDRCVSASRSLVFSRNGTRATLGPMPTSRSRSSLTTSTASITAKFIAKLAFGQNIDTGHRQLYPYKSTRLLVVFIAANLRARQTIFVSVKCVGFAWKLNVERGTPTPAESSKLETGQRFPAAWEQYRM